MSIPPSRIAVHVEEHERWRRTLTITVPTDVVRRERDRAAERLARRLKLPGFRKGRVPTAVLERQHGPALQEETFDRVIGEAYRAALLERDLQPISEGEVEDVDYQLETGLTFRVSFDVRPRIELSRLGGFRVERSADSVEPGDVELVLERLREENAVWRPPAEHETPRDGDLVTVRIVSLAERGEGGAQGTAAPGGRTAGDVGLPWARRLRLRADTGHRGRYQFVLGEGDATPALEEAVRSLLPGETRDFLLGPHEGSEEGSAAGEQRVRVTLEDWRTRELPELDDVFARSLGDFADLADLRRRVLGHLEEESAARAEGALRARLLDLVIEANPFTVPLSMVERYGQERASEGDPDCSDRVRAELGLEAERSVKRLLVLERVAELEDLEATREEVDARVAEIAERAGVGPDEVRARLRDSDRLETLAREITEKKVLDFLVSRSEIVGL